MNENGRKAVKAPADNIKFMLKGPAGSGKSTTLQERYKYMTETLGIPGENILILLLNRNHLHNWTARASSHSSGRVWAATFYGFIQEELKTFYPLALKNCNEISCKRVKPIFLSTEASVFLLAKAVQARRESRNMFAAVTSYSDRIAYDLALNLVKAAASGIPAGEIGSRLYDSLQREDDIKRMMLSEAGEVLQAYRKRCMELGVFDLGLAVELYSSCLMTDETYRKNLFQRVQHIIVDNMEDCVPAEVDFIELLMPRLRTCLLAYNPEGGCSPDSMEIHEYIGRKIFDKCEILEFERTFTCSDFMSEFSDMLFNGIERGRNNHVRNSGDIERNPPFELRSEMLERAGERICRLIAEEGFKPSEIAVISTYADPVTEFVMSRILERQGFKLANLSRKPRAADNIYALSLITLARLCHPEYGIFPNRDHIRVLIRLLFEMDPVRSSILAGKICGIKPFPGFPSTDFAGLMEIIGDKNLEKYNRIYKWTSDYRGTGTVLPLNDFFQKAFIELLISEHTSNTDVIAVKKLIDVSEAFSDALTKFNRNAGRDFLEMAGGGLKLGESVFELEEKLEDDSVILTTPAAFLALSIHRKVTVLLSASSGNWAPRTLKELSNPHVLSKTWKEGSIYTEELEAANQRHYLAGTVRSLLKKCREKLIIFESGLSANGFENDGILAEVLDEIL